jgi:PhzF family phenazine biosynthesis protein
MATLRYYIIDVFTSTAYQGNPLAVVDTTTTPPLTNTQMKLISRQFNLSETTFICPPTSTKATWRLRSFLPNGEEVFGAGHNSLGAWWWIAHSGLVDVDVTPGTPQSGRIYHQQLGDNILPVEISQSNPGDIIISMRQGQPQFLNKHTNPEHLSRSLGIKESDVGLKYAGIELELDEARVVTTSPARHLLVPVRDMEVLRNVSFADKDGIAQELASTNSYNSGVYVFTSVASEGGSTVPRFEARFFSPGMGMEDPATGSAAGPLAAYMWAKSAGTLGDKMTQIEVLQGVQTGRRCLMKLRVEVVEDGYAISISGTGVLVADGNIVIPSLDVSF